MLLHLHRQINAPRTSVTPAPGNHHLPKTYSQTPNPSPTTAPGTPKLRNTSSAAAPAQIPLSLLFSELIGYCVNAVRLHVTAADVLVSHGVDKGDFR